MDIPIPSSKPLEDVALPGKVRILEAIRRCNEVRVSYCVFRIPLFCLGGKRSNETFTQYAVRNYR